MPYESNKKVLFGYIDEKGFHEIPVETENIEVDENGNVAEKKPEMMVAKRFWERYKCFTEVGFDEKQAFSLTRDWFQYTLEGYYVND